MDKSTNTGSKAADKDTFKNTPHVANNVGADVGSDLDVSASSNVGSRAGVGSSMSSGRFADAKNAIVEQAGPAIDYVRTNFKPVLESSQQYLGDARGIITRHPFYAIAGAAALGVFVGMMFSKPSRSV